MQHARNINFVMEIEVVTEFVVMGEGQGREGVAVTRGAMSGDARVGGLKGSVLGTSA